MKVADVRNAKYFYRQHPDVGCIVFEADEAGFSFKTELNMQDAVSLADDLIDLIEWITDGKITWTKEVKEETA